MQMTPRPLIIATGTQHVGNWPRGGGGWAGGAHRHDGCTPLAFELGDLGDMIDYGHGVCARQERALRHGGADGAERRGQAAALNAEASTTPHAAGPGGRTFLGANGAIGPPIGRAAAPTTARRPSGFAGPSAASTGQAASMGQVGREPPAGHHFSPTQGTARPSLRITPEPKSSFDISSPHTVL